MLVPVLCLYATSAQARIERFAVVVGNNHGDASDHPLRYAEDDAARVHNVLVQLGDVSPTNAVLLQGESADRVRDALLQINGRIRDMREDPSVEVMLFVYYSGHADARALRLGGTRLTLAELRQHAHGSAANLRLVVLDACRSGALTRVKGGRREAPFALTDPQEKLPGSGFAFLTASSASEDAQESDALRGGFFTHAFVSGLLGAADADGDGMVVLDEVYRYAYGATLRATSRTFAGTQHPTCHYELRGRGRWVLTRPAAHAHQRATIVVPPKLGFLFMRGAEDGPVIAELAPSRRRRQLSLPPGRYFVRVRAPEVLYEGTIDTRPGRTKAIDTGAMSRIDYARLVRKGGDGKTSTHGPEVGASVRSALANSSKPCVGALVGYGLELSSFGVSGRIGTCFSELQAAGPQASVRAHDAALRLHYAWDLPAVTLLTGFGAGLSIFDQRFETRGSAPTRVSVAPFVALGLGARLGLSRGWYLGLDADGQTHFLRIIDPAEPTDPLVVGFAVRTSALVGKQF